MKKLPYMKWYPSDYLADTPPASAATWEHHGIYTLLLFKTWLMASHTLPDDDKWLALHMGCSVEDVQARVRPVLEMYFERRQGKWSHRRLNRDIAKAASFSKKQSANAKALKTPKKNEAKPKPKEPSGSAYYSYSYSYSQKGVFDTLTGVDVFAPWYERYPRKRGKRDAMRAFAKALNDKTATLEELHAGLDRAIEAWRREGTPADKTPHPATWLNGARWEDDTAAPVRGNGSSNHQRATAGGQHGHSASTVGGLNAAARIRQGSRGAIGGDADSPRPSLPTPTPKRSGA